MLILLSLKSDFVADWMSRIDPKPWTFSIPKPRLTRPQKSSGRLRKLTRHMELWQENRNYPLVNIQKAIENDPFSSLIYPLKVVMFHSFFVNVDQRITNQILTQKIWIQPTRHSYGGAWRTWSDGPTHDDFFVLFLLRLCENSLRLLKWSKKNKCG